MTEILRISPAAGWLKRPEMLLPLAELELPEIGPIGSFTLPPREGNRGRTYHHDDFMGASWNSLNLPNMGLEALSQVFVEFVKNAGNSILRISISPLQAGDIYKMVHVLCKLAKDYNVTIIIEVNLGCPNVWDKSGQKPLTTYDLEAVEGALMEVSAGRTDGNVGVSFAVKFSPILPHLAVPLVNLCHRHRIPEIVVTNTWPNALLFDEESEQSVIQAEDQNGDVVTTVGGLSGAPLFPIALSNVWWLSQAIKRQGYDMTVTGVGGIDSAAHVWQFEQAGASKFQVGRAFFDTGDPRIFSNICTQYAGVNS